MYLCTFCTLYMCLCMNILCLSGREMAIETEWVLSEWVSEKNSAIFSQFFIRHTITWLLYIIRLVHARSVYFLCCVDARMSRCHKHSKTILVNVITHENEQPNSNAQTHTQRNKTKYAKRGKSVRTKVRYTNTLKQPGTRASPLTNCIPFYRYACIKSQTAITIVCRCLCRCCVLFHTQPTIHFIAPMR